MPTRLGQHLEPIRRGVDSGMMEFPIYANVMKIVDATWGIQRDRKDEIDAHSVPNFPAKTTDTPS